MAQLTITRSITIKSPIEKIYQILNNFTHWQAWSPWLVMEPEAKVFVADNGKAYEWQGHRIGSGHMQITQETKNQQIEYDLQFIKPWKSKAKVRFELQSQVDQTTVVTWHMHSQLPFFLFFMKRMMTAFIGADYERGLHMLQAYAEQGHVPSKLDFVGHKEFAGCFYIGVKTQCAIQRLKEYMEKDFQKIQNYSKQHPDTIAGPCLSIYHKWNLVQRHTTYTAAIMVKDKPIDIPEGFICGEIPHAEVYTLKHTGPYHFLVNAWSTLYSMQRNREFKSKKGIPPFEIYLNNPQDTDAKDLCTEIHFITSTP